MLKLLLDSEHVHQIFTKHGFFHSTFRPDTDCVRLDTVRYFICRDIGDERPDSELCAAERGGVRSCETRIT